MTIRNAMKHSQWRRLRKEDGRMVFKGEGLEVKTIVDNMEECDRKVVDM